MHKRISKDGVEERREIGRPEVCFIRGWWKTNERGVLLYKDHFDLESCNLHSDFS